MRPASRKSKLNCPHFSFCCKEEVCCKQRTWNRDHAGHTIGLIQQTNGGTRQLHQVVVGNRPFQIFYEKRNLLLHSGTTGKRQQLARKDDASARIERAHLSRERRINEAFTHRSFYTEKLSNRNAFTHKSFYTQRLLHRKVSTRREKMLPRRRFQIVYAHTNALAQSSLYTEAFTQLLHREAVIHTETCTQRTTFYI